MFGSCFSILVVLQHFLAKLNRMFGSCFSILVFLQNSIGCLTRASPSTLFHVIVMVLIRFHHLYMLIMRHPFYSASNLGKGYCRFSEI